MTNNTISVILPTKNRPDDLIHAVISILDQKHLPNELIIVDQSDNKKSYQAVRKIFNNINIVLKLNYVYEPKIKGLVEAKQKGVSIAKGDVICFLEDDIVLHNNYFVNVFKIFEKQENLMGCCGVMTNNHSGNIYEILFKLFHLGIFYDARLNIGKKKDCNGEGFLISSRFLSGGISCYRKNVFENVSFDLRNDFHMLEDIDFSTRAADFYGDEHFFIVSNICLKHNMSPVNREKLKYRWQRKLREYVVYYKKNSFKPWALINLIWLLVGLFGESIISSILMRNLGPFLGTIIGLYHGVQKKITL